jgi:hypothetical protein
MRRVSQFIVAVAAVCLLAGSAEAREQNGEAWYLKYSTPVAKQIRKVIRAFGDGLTIPKP